MWISRRRWGVKCISGSDTPPEVVSGLCYWWAEPVWMDKLAAWSRGLWSDTWLTAQVLHPTWYREISHKVTLTWPNKSNVVIVTLFGNSYVEKNTADIRGEASVLSPVRKTASVNSKNFNSPSDCDENKSLWRSVLRTETSVNFPPENGLRPCEWGSQIDRGHQENTLKTRQRYHHHRHAFRSRRTSFLCEFTMVRL